ncbi:MAG: membrane protein insertion efficiency factor YidD [Candidatus Aegiribacteria sp.]|nr:membrane protein insertion efficiency factor YidD [Candidatus Aegiribacteria sp.]MBD3294867.1 membrane protein insertion efficiency factor YidD [Candidatus Fermentibacteria bacterium]
MNLKMFLPLLILVPICYCGSVASEVTHGGEMTGVLFCQYRLIFSDLLGRSCVFDPSCSRYAQKAVGSKGPLLGIMAGLERWTRCNSGAYSCSDYTRGEDGHLLDPVELEQEVTHWGRSLLLF